MQLFRARDAEVLLDLGGLGDGNVEAKPGGRQRACTGHSGLEKIPTRDYGQRSLCLLTTNGGAG